MGFLHADKRKCYLQANFNTLGIKVSYKVILSLLMGMIKHSLKTQSNKFAISLQYLKKEARNGAQFFCMQINISFYKLGLSFLPEVFRHIQTTQYLKKKVSHLLLCSIEMQSIHIFYGGSIMFSVNCYIIFHDTTLKS